jgi:hypothetical protein
VLRLKKQNHFFVIFFLCSADTLGGHLDDMEADWSKPIISLRYLSIPPFLFFPPFVLCSYKNTNKWSQDHVRTWFYLSCFLSLGCKAIFLLGGKSREDPPLAMFLRSGDIVLMAGEARECFHGKCKLSASVLFVWSIYGWCLFLLSLLKFLTSPGFLQFNAYFQGDC